MKRYIRFASGHPYLLAALVVVLFLPWVWMAPLVPQWALLIALALVPVAALLALALVVKDLNADDEGNPLATDDPLKWRKRTRLFQQVVVGLDTMLERWDSASRDNQKRLDTVTESVEEVIKLTEAAVNEISKSFRIVVQKANEQTEAAMSLLKGEGQGARGVLSLPEFIQAYDSQLVNVTSHMTSFSTAAGSLPWGGVRMHQRFSKSSAKPASGPECSVPATGGRGSRRAAAVPEQRAPSRWRRHPEPSAAKDLGHPSPFAC